jgi:hypothetical protein
MLACLCRNLAGVKVRDRKLCIADLKALPVRRKRIVHMARIPEKAPARQRVLNKIVPMGRVPGRVNSLPHR